MSISVQQDPDVCSTHEGRASKNNHNVTRYTEKGWNKNKVCQQDAVLQPLTSVSNASLQTAQKWTPMPELIQEYHKMVK